MNLRFLINRENLTDAGERGHHKKEKGKRKWQLEK